MLETSVQTPLTLLASDTDDPLHLLLLLLFNSAASSDAGFSLVEQLTLLLLLWLIVLNFSMSALQFMSRSPTAELLRPVSAFKGSPLALSPPPPPSPNVPPESPNVPLLFFTPQSPGGSKAPLDSDSPSRPMQ